MQKHNAIWPSFCRFKLLFAPLLVHDSMFTRAVYSWYGLILVYHMMGSSKLFWTRFPTHRKPTTPRRLLMPMRTCRSPWSVGFGRCHSHLAGQLLEQLMWNLENAAIQKSTWWIHILYMYYNHICIRNTYLPYIMAISYRNQPWTILVHFNAWPPSRSNVCSSSGAIIARKLLQ